MSMNQQVETTELMRRWMALRPVSAEVARVNAVAEDLRGYLQANGVLVAAEELDGRRILYAATQPGKVQDVLLNAHLDVVPADAALFTLREADGRFFGRGVHDCLGNAALIANLLARLNGRASVGAVFSTDEEIGGATTAAMVARGYGAHRLVLVLDGDGDAVTVAQKGILNVRLIAHGHACHAAEPWKGENAIDLLLDGYAKVRPLFPPVRDDDSWHDTMAATILRAGSVCNRIPETAEMNLNLRFTEPSGDQAIVERLRAVSGLEVCGHVDCQPLRFSGATPAIRGLVQFMEKRRARPIAVKHMNGATDARHFAALGVPVAILGVPGENAHASDEFLDAAALGEYEAMLADFILSGLA